MPIAENMTMAVHPSLFPGAWLRLGAETALAREFLRDLGIKASGPEAPGGSLSGGNQQKCIIGRWLQTQPQILLLDDPTRGVDVGAKAELYRLIDQLVRPPPTSDLRPPTSDLRPPTSGSGIGVIMTSSELPELLTVCDRILVLSEGRLTAAFLRGEATEQKIMEAATHVTRAN